MFFLIRHCLAGLLLCALLSDCSGGLSAIPNQSALGRSIASNSNRANAFAEVVASYPAIAQQHLPAGATLDVTGQLVDSLARNLIWDMPDKQWKVVDHGMFIDATQTAPTSVELANYAKAVAALASQTSASASKRSAQVLCQTGTTCAPTVYAQGGDSYVQYTTYRMPDSECQGNGLPTLNQGPDGNYYDGSGNQWIQDGDGNCWTQTIGRAVTGGKPAASTTGYYTAYNFINGLAPWFYGAATLPLFAGYVPWGALVAHLTSRGAGWLTTLALLNVRNQIAASGVTLTALSSQQANQIMASYGYSNPPFIGAVYQFVSNTALQNGIVDGEQLVRVGADSDAAAGGPWLMAQSSITISGSYIAPAEIQDLYAIPGATPAYVATVTSIPSGTPMFLGIAAPQAGYAGGGIQFFAGGMIGFSSPVPLP